MPRRAALAVLLLLALPATGSAQERTCDLIESGRIERQGGQGVPMLDFLDPFYFRCSDGAELRARSGTLNEALRRLTLVGDVFFQDDEQTLTADEAVYHSAIGHLEASGNVVFTNRSEGSEIRGPAIEYYRAMEGRPDAQVTATQRPHLTLRPDEGDDEPLELDADRVIIVGQNDLTAYGSVVIARSDLDATADEARYLEAEEQLELRGGARVETEDYTLDAEVIQARLEEGVLRHMRAVTDASLRGERLSLDAPELQLFFEGEQLQRAVARVREEGQRANAVARGFRLGADSLDAILPGQQLERVIAIGDARGQTVDTLAAATPDTAALAVAAPDTAVAAPADSAALAAAALALAENDWIAGDTVIGYFAPDTTAAPGDTASVVLQRLVATGDAQSLYRIAQADNAQADTAQAPAQARRGLNYLAGAAIELTFAEGELDVAEVTGLQRGLYLDPVPPGNEEPATPPADVVDEPAEPALGGEER